MSCLQIFTKKMYAHPASLFLVITMGPFTTWGVDFMTFNPIATEGHHYIIVEVDYFLKWDEDMPTIRNDGETAAYFLFNKIISRFDVPQELVSDHGSHF